MSFFVTSDDKVVIEEYHEEESEILHIGSEGGGGDTADEGGYQQPRPPGSGGSVMEVEKRIRREIANSNERRRMQSINAGFQSLRTLLPHHEGEKLSKAAILQQTAEYIYALEQEKTRLLSQNCQLKRLVNQHEGGDLPAKKRRLHISSSQNHQHHQQSGADEAETTTSLLSLSSPEPEEVRVQLEQERRMRAVLEDRVRELEARVYSSHHQPQQTGGVGVATQNQAAYLHRGDVIEHTNNVTIQETNAAVARLEDEMLLVPADSLPPVAITQTVVSMPLRSPSPTSCIVKEEPRCITPAIHEHALSEQTVTIKSEHSTENSSSIITITATPVAINCSEDSMEEDKNTQPSLPQTTSANRPYLTGNKTRQNLETIVEAIRHLEGDHMFDDRTLSERSSTVVGPTQDAPLALTTSTKQHPPHLILRPNVMVGNTITSGNTTFAQFQRQQQCRPGVIVVKQQS